MSAVGHALLSASKAHQWLNCPPSIRLTEHMPDTTSEYAAQGTLAHAMGELMLLKYFTNSIKPSEYKTRMTALHAEPMYDPEMDGYVQRYVDAVKEAGLVFTNPPYVAVESRVNYAQWVPEGFGTCDAMLIGDNTLHIFDIKYGKGVPVSADDNPQMTLYALGAYVKYSLAYSIHTVRMTICQPRLDAISTAVLPISDLTAWGDSIKETAQQAFDGGGEYRAGDWCRWCKAKGCCAARAKSIVEADFSPVPAPRGKPLDLLTPSDIAGYLKLADAAKKWLNDLEEYTLQAVLRGEVIPGWKAVNGRATRQWTDQDAAFKAAVDAGVPDAILYERKPLTLAAVEKVVGKTEFADKLSQYVTTPPGKPTLVEQSDKRPAINTIYEDFRRMY